MIQEPDLQAKKLLGAIQQGRGLSIQYDGFTLLFVPGSAIEAMSHSRSVTVVELGQGSLVIENPTRFNKFIFASAGFTLPAGKVAATIMKCLMNLLRENRAQQETGKTVRIEAPIEA